MVLIRKKKKLTEEEIEAERKEKELRASGLQDEFQAKGFELVTWVQHHKPRIIVGLGAIACAMIIWLGISYFSSGTQVSASGDFEAASKILEKASLAAESEKAGLQRQALKAFEDISTKYSSSGVAKLSDLRVGDLSLSLKDSKTAVAAFERAWKGFAKDDPLKQIAGLGLASAYEADLDSKKALEMLESILNGSVKIDEAMVLWQAQRLAKEMGQTKKADGFSAQLAERYFWTQYADQTYILPKKSE